MGQIRVIVEGVTASGKTTMVKLLAERLGLQDAGEEFRGQYAAVGRFVHEQRWAFPMQLNFLTTRFVQNLMVGDRENGILDRSLFGDMVYADAYRKLRYFSEGQYQTYLNLYQFLLSYVVMPKLMIFTRCPLRVLMDRLRKRNNPAELAAGEDFWETVFESYESFIEGLPSNKAIRNYLVVDTDRLNLVDDESQKERFIDDVRGRLEA